METKPYKILHVIPAYGGGISSYVKNLIAAPNQDNIVMDVAGFGTFPNSFVEVVTSYGGRVYPLPSVHKSFAAFIKAYRAVLCHRYDALHCHFSGYKGWIFKRMARMAGVPLIITHAHRTDDESKEGLYQVSLRLSQALSRSCSDCYMTCSEMAAAFIFGADFVRHHPVWMMPNTIRPSQYRDELTAAEQREYLAKLGLTQKDRIILGHIGRFNKQKNHPFLLDIARRLKQDGLDFVMLLIGDGDNFQKIQRAVLEEHLEDRVFFWGKRNDVSRILKWMDLMLLPSLYEGLPTVAVEAQAAGTPCLLADTITRQTDLGLNLVRFLPIHPDAACWCEAIEHFSPGQPADYAQRIEQMKQKGFIDSEMRKKYAESISSYEKAKRGCTHIQCGAVSGTVCEKHHQGQL